MTQASLAGIPIRIKILRTPEEQAEGFMFKPEPKPGFGLLFLYDAPGEDALKASSLGGATRLSFWMRGVAYPLDLIALDRALCVRKVYSLRASDETPVRLEVGCQHALEMRSGWCRANGILVGDKLEIEDL